MRYILTMLLILSSAAPALADDWLIFDTVNGTIPDGALYSSVWSTNDASDAPVTGSNIPSTQKAIACTLEQAARPNYYKAVSETLVERPLSEMITQGEE